jgi:hypothetical protein
MKNEMGKVLFLGSMPGDSATQVMQLCAQEAGKHFSFLPDGETGFRSQWIQFLAANIYNSHPSFITVQRPGPKNGIERWHNEAYNDPGWLFRLQEGVTQVRFEELGYAAAARKSYAEFCVLRNAGVIAAGTRFQVSMPLTESATRIFMTNAADFEILKEAFEEVMTRELDAMFASIPASDLVIQWDLALEVLYTVLDGKTPWTPEGAVSDRMMQSLNLMAAHIPEEAMMGCHLCYGDLGHKHLVEPPDLGLSVQIANRIVKDCVRRVDYFHMPVPRNRNDEAYFAPLKDLQIGDAKLYLGLIHLTDGAEGAQSRIAAAGRYAAEFGVATECGMGRRSKESLPALLRVHSEVAAGL